MGRRHLSFLAPLVAALAFVAPAGAAVHWTVLAAGPAGGAQTPSTVAFVSLDRASTSRFSDRISSSAEDRLARVDFRKQSVIAVFGKFGCQDYRIGVKSIVQHGSRVVVSLVRQPLAPNTMECQAIFPTYRLLVVAKTQLSRPYPTRAEARVASA